MLKFSVLMSVYKNDQPDDFSKCLESLFKQSLPPNELIIVHDGPISDGLIAVENKYREKLNIKSIKLLKNVGTGLAKNEGLKIVTNDYIAIMDADDIAVPDRFLDEISFLNDNPNIDIVGGFIEEFDPDTHKRISTRRVPIEHDAIVKFAKKRSPFNNQTVIYKKSVIRSVGGYSDMLYQEDYDLFLRIIFSGAQCANIPKVLCHVRSGSQQIARRGGGLLYFKYTRKILNMMRNENFISSAQMIYILTIKTIVCFSPIWLRVIFYKIIRKFF